VAATYRHDLGSFFYVLLWICARRAWEKYESWFDQSLKQSRLTKWNTGSYHDIAGAKEHHMGVSGFKAILEEFPQALSHVKPLCREIRGVLFPLLEDGVLHIGTLEDAKELYDPIIRACENAIAKKRAKDK